MTRGTLLAVGVVVLTALLALGAAPVVNNVGRYQVVVIPLGTSGTILMVDTAEGAAHPMFLDKDAPDGTPGLGAYWGKPIPFQ